MEAGVVDPLAVALPVLGEHGNSEAVHLAAGLARGGGTWAG